jgi:hypothetical protein
MRPGGSEGFQEARTWSASRLISIFFSRFSLNPIISSLLDRMVDILYMIRNFSANRFARPLI